MVTNRQKIGMRNQQAACSKLKDQTGGGARGVSGGVFVALHSAPPPPLESYQLWFAKQLAGTRGKQNKMTAEKLRRAVIMVRNGYTASDAGRALSITSGCVRKWLDALPEDMRA